MSVRRGAAAALLLLAVVLAALAALRLVDNPDVRAQTRNGHDTHPCLAPWDTVFNGATNIPGGDPPPDADAIATRCRHAAYAHVDQAHALGGVALAALAGAGALLLTRRRGVVASIVVTTIAACAAGGLAWAGWERRHPSAFADSGASMGFDPLPVGKSAYFGVTWPGNPESDVKIETARPMVRSNTASASIDLFVCIPRKGADQAGVILQDDIDASCTDLVPLAGDTPPVHLTAARKAQVLIRIRTDAPGEVKVAGVEFVYRDGWRHGRQEVRAPVAAISPPKDR